ncbi:ABC transporter substrate-binding protein [Paraliobacillus quinghaiensis]|uniref:ABC transporter substrate-binding protein n=1 Tax=Paraliobacillus quinghaiensis TaxID=470815 RepID=A0A917TWX8_9BACI|nr:ABC transporter substrate-binding protein [Paraliobacillus quinghaiensis]GGM40815.1 ABC transporter substrate-binding protein [Paraliobacillus quinghaiensis]
MNKSFWMSLIAIISILVLVACGANEDSSSDTEGEETYTIGASQFVEHPSLDAAYEGFQAAIEDAGLNVDYDLQSAQGDQNNTGPIAQGFVADNVDLIFANATPSAQAAYQATKDIPILFTSVTDGVEAGLVESMDQPGDNITGVMDLHPDAISNTVSFIETYFEGATVGVIYNAGEQNSVSQIDLVKEAIDGTSLNLVERTVSTSAEVQQSATSLVGDADVFYIVTDNTVVTALEAVVGVANEQDIPLIVGEPDSLTRGGFATYGIDYHTIGYRTGEMAVEILTGEKTAADIPPEYPPSMQLFINKGAAEDQGVEWNDTWDDEAEFKETAEE